MVPYRSVNAEAPRIQLINGHLSNLKRKPEQYKYFNYVYVKYITMYRIALYFLKLCVKINNHILTKTYHYDKKEHELTLVSGATRWELINKGPKVQISII